MSPADDIDSPGRTGGDSLPSSTWGEPRTLEVIDPAIDREAVDSTGRVGAVAYPYAVYAASVRVPRPVFDARVDEYVVSVDRTRRLALRVDAVPAVREVDLRDCHVLEPAVSLEKSSAKARDAVIEWTLRRFSPPESPTVDLDRSVAGYKLFWLAERPDGDVIVDSVRGTERPLAD